MSYREDYLFWQLVYALVKQKYRVLHFSMDQSEIWLENFTNKKFPIIRIKRENIDWSRWLREDIQHVFEQGEQIRKSALRNNLAILNIYVTQLPPVDSYEMWVGKRLEMNQQKTAVYPILLVGDNLGETIPEVTKILGFNPFKQVYTEYDYYDVEQMKNAALQEARQLEQKERELLNHSKPFFTYVFLSIQIIVFFLMEIAGGSLNPLVLLAFGAKYNPLIIEGEWWRFFTPIFLHIGFFHLLMNSLALYYLGTMVEKIYGNVRFLIIYLFAGFFGTLTSFMFTPNVSAGASGAILVYSAPSLLRNGS